MVENQPLIILDTPVTISQNVEEWGIRDLVRIPRNDLALIREHTEVTPESGAKGYERLITSRISGSREIQSPQRILVSAAQRNAKGEIVSNSTALYVNTVIFCPSIPEYPKTSLGGVMYVIPLAALSEAEISV